MGLAQVSSGLAVCEVVENAGSGATQLGITLKPCPCPVGQPSGAGQMKKNACLVPGMLQMFTVSVAVLASAVLISTIPHLMGAKCIYCLGLR